MLSEGHPAAARYPLWQLSLEATLATQRVDVLLASQVALINQAINAAFNQDAHTAFIATLDGLDYRAW